MSRASTGALELAGVGHRITHEDDLPEAIEIAQRTLSHAEQVLERGRRTEPKLALAIGAALALLKKSTGKKQSSPSEDAGQERAKNECPDPCGAIEAGSKNTFIGKDQRAVALVGAQGTPCEDHDDDPICKGSANVWVNGKRVARRSDETECGALIGEGENTIWIGAETAKEGERKIADKLEQFLHNMVGDLVTGKRMNSTLTAQHLADALRGNKTSKAQKCTGGATSGASLGAQLTGHDCHHH